jgi:Raf kinase inhibitor-like YbhB/YbcL family protein
MGKKVGIFILLVVIGSAAFAFFKFFRKPTKSTFDTGSKLLEEGVMRDMKLASSVFENNKMISAKYTCDGDNVSPPLEATDVPEDAKSLALVVDDPDAPGGDWVHWLVWNIDPKVGQITEGEVPENSVQGLTDFGKAGYGGPCPPTGTHRYKFKLYALDTNLDLGSDARKKDLEDAMKNHILEQSTLVGLYKRN